MKTIKRLAAIWPTALRDLAGLCGAGCVAYGAGAIYQPAGFIVLGSMLLSAAFLSARASA